MKLIDIVIILLSMKAQTTNYSNLVVNLQQSEWHFFHFSSTSRYSWLSLFVFILRWVRFSLFPCLKIFIYFVTTKMEALSPSIMVEGKWRCVKDSWQGKDGCSAIQNLSNYFGVSIIGGKQIFIIQFQFSVSKLKKKSVWIFELFLNLYI